MKRIFDKLGKTLFTEKCVLIALLDEKFKINIEEYLNRNITSSEKLQNLFYEISHNSKKYFKKFRKANTLIDKILNFEISLGYFSLLESLNETSYILDYILNNLKNKYGKRYIDKIIKVDKECLSIDTIKFLNKENKEKTYEDDLLNMYVVMKKWQDLQHIYSVEKYDKYIYDIEDEYIKYFNNKYISLFEFCNRKMYENIALKALVLEKKYLSKQVVSIEKITKLLFLKMDREVIKIYGGKAYGLAKLKKVNALIPNTFCVSYINYKRAYEELKIYFNEENLAIRSSANVEDGKKNSFAGMFESYLNINIKDADKYIEKVMLSKNNNRVNEYAKKNNIFNIQVSVIVQTFSEPTYAGVFLGQAEDKGILEYVKGNGEKLVSGSVTPITKEINKNKEFKIDNLDITKYLLNLQKKLKEICDFEFCILNGQIVMLQFRPVTQIITTCIKNELIKENEYIGIAASSGVYKGRATYIRKINETGLFKDKDILMCWYTNPDWVELISKSSAVVTAVGGFLCHTAIIAREFEIPCVIGIGPDNMKKIWNEKNLIVDGNNGKVKVLK